MNGAKSNIGWLIKKRATANTARSAYKPVLGRTQAGHQQHSPAIVAAHPDARWLFLTLTVKNPKMSDLRDNLLDMNKAWGRLKELK